MSSQDRNIIKYSQGYSHPQRGLKGKYDIRAPEFPLFVLSPRIPQDLQKQNAIRYIDTIKNGTVERQVTIKGSPALGLGTGSTQDVYYAIHLLWKDQGFENREIKLGTLSSLLKFMGQPTDGHYIQRLKKDLTILKDIEIEAINMYYDFEMEKYVDQTYGLFTDWKRFKDKSDYHSQSDLIVAYPSNTLYEAAQGGELITLQDDVVRRLKSYGAKRLLFYITKMLYSQRVHRRDLMTFAAQIPIRGDYPSDVKKVLDPWMHELLQEDLTPRFTYSYEESADGHRENIVFRRLDGLDKELPRKSNSTVELFIDMMQEATGEQDNRSYYAKVAFAFSETTIYEMIAELKDYRDNEIKKSRARLFTSIVKKYALRDNVSM